MDINDFRGLMSAVILFAFLGLILFTLMGGRDRFRDAADAPFADDRDADPGEAGDHDREAQGHDRHPSRHPGRQGGRQGGQQDGRRIRDAQPEGRAR